MTSETAASIAIFGILLTAVIAAVVSYRRRVAREARLSEIRKAEEARLSEVQRLEEMQAERERLELLLARLNLEAKVNLRPFKEYRDKIVTFSDYSHEKRTWFSRDARNRVVANRPESTAGLNYLETEIAQRYVGVAVKDRQNDYLGRQLVQLGGELCAEIAELRTYWNLDLKEHWAEQNREILAKELIEQKDFLSSIETKPLTQEQATAVITFDNRVQLIAAAGSGKTSVMVARAAYAVHKGYVPAKRILLLAFNRAAAKELQVRVTTRLKAAGIDSAGLHAATFHSFGLTAIGKATGKKPRLASWVGSSFREQKMIMDIVDSLRDSSVDFRFRWDIYRILLARMGEGPDSGEADWYDKETKINGFRTARGETVRSQGERLIADFLFFNGVDYEYEKAYAPKGQSIADESHSEYRPDFYYPDIDVWHEHWALGRNGLPPASFQGYAEGMKWKRNTHKQFGTTLIETSWAEIIDNSGFGPFANKLEELGLTFDWNPDRDAPGAEPMKHVDLARLIRTFMTHVKSNSLTESDLRKRLVSGLSPLAKFRTQMFLDIYWEIHHEWQHALREEDAIDFEDMLIQAAEHLETGAVDLGYQLVLVDEFQDASQARARLARALVKKPDRYLLAVGDDWQAINRFAGADISVMTSFDEFFGEAQELRLQTTFRSPQAICDAASEFVSRNPRQFRKGVKSIHDGYGRLPSLLRVDTADEITEGISEILKYISDRAETGEIEYPEDRPLQVDVLGRYNFEKDLMPVETPGNLLVEFRTIHASKGLEADYVVIPSMGSGTYGFPSEIVDDPVLALAMPDPDPYPHAEERRLFYVALTRARREVALISVKGKESPFIGEMLKLGKLTLLKWGDDDEDILPCPACGSGVLVLRNGPYSDFYGCSGFPKCRHIQKIDD